MSTFSGEDSGPSDFSAPALDGWLPDGSVLYFECGYPDEEIDNFMEQYSISEQTHISFGTRWPKTKVFHVPATKELLISLCKIMEHHAEPELAVHFHVYRQEKVLIEWHDAFDGGMLVCGDFREEQVKDLSKKLGTQYKKVEPALGP